MKKKRGKSTKKKPARRKKRRKSTKKKPASRKKRRKSTKKKPARRKKRRKSTKKKPARRKKQGKTDSEKHKEAIGNAIREMLGKKINLTEYEKSIQAAMLNSMGGGKRFDGKTPEGRSKAAKKAADTLRKKRSRMSKN